jgi:hypothetical protein
MRDGKDMFSIRRDSAVADEMMLAARAKTVRELRKVMELTMGSKLLHESWHCSACAQQVDNNA